MSMAQRGNSVDRISLAQAGRGRAPSAWATIAAAAALASGAVWLGVAVVRPMPATPTARAATSPERRPTPIAESPRAVERAALLARLDEMGNIFAPDRAPWPDSAIADAADEPTHEVSDAPVRPPIAPATPTGSAGPPAYDQIEVAQTPPPAVDREMKSLHLRGIFRTPRGAAAMIQDAADTTSRGRALLLRRGQSFRNGDWRVVAIDAEGKRVILSRAGVNVELSLYDIPAGAARVAQAQAPVVQPAPPSVVVQTRTPEQARADLLAAGISAADVDEILRLAQEAPANPAIAATPEPSAPVLKSAPGVSDDMRALLKMMAEGVSPTGGSKRPDHEKPQPDGGK